jgi:DNA-nicking Smr family endonuclease
MRSVSRLRADHAPAEKSEAPMPKPAVPPGTPRHAPTPQPSGSGLDRRSAQRLKRGQLAIEARLDLHGMTQAEAHRALSAFIARCRAAGMRTVLIITGKSGVLYGAVPRWLEESDNRARILASSRAQAQHGGAGALYVLLRRRR